MLLISLFAFQQFTWQKYIKYFEYLRYYLYLARIFLAPYRIWIKQKTNNIQ